MRVHAGQGAAGQSDFVGFKALSAADQAFELLLDRGVGRVGLEGPLHMPDGGIKVSLILTDDRHADMRDKIIGDRGQHALEDIGRVSVALGLQIGFAEQAVAFDALRICLQDMSTVGNRLVELLALDEVVDIPQVRSQSCISHNVKLKVCPKRDHSARRFG